MSSDSEDPVLTVLIPAFNPGFEWLLESIISVTSQTFESMEIFVVDDGSTDGSVEAVKAEFDDHRIQWMTQENIGKPATINKIARMARGRYFAVQDADDISHPERFERQIDALEADSALAGVFCGYDVIVAGKRMAPSAKPLTKEQCEECIQRYQMPSHDPTACYPTSVILDFPYAEDLPSVEGVDFILRVGECRPFERIEGVLYSYRIHPDSITKSDPAAVAARIGEVYRRAIERRGESVPDSLVSRNPEIGKRDDNSVFRVFIVSVKEQIDQGSYRRALRTAWDSITVSPFDFCYYRPLVHVLLPKKIKRILGARQ